MLFIIKAARRITNIVITGLLYLLEQVQLVAWDLFLSFFNIVLPSLRPTAVIPAGSPGAGGQWPEYISPKDGDSRGACPALNALANHGILPHDGKNITFRQATNATRVYNHSPSFRYFIPKRMADILNRDYWTDTFDLSDINVHNGIEHDASFSREDSYFTKDQSRPSISRVQRLLASGTAPGGNLTAADLSTLLGQLRSESKTTNPQYSQKFLHMLTGSANASFLLTTFGGKVEDIGPFLLEERLPKGWQPRILDRFGLSILNFSKTIVKIELGIEAELGKSLVAGKIAGKANGSTEKAR